VLIIKNNRLFNTVSNRWYSGTGSWFNDDMLLYLDSRVRPQSKVASHNNNLDGDHKYKFWFSVKNNTVDIFYYDDTKAKIIFKDIYIRLKTNSRIRFFILHLVMYNSN
jgi:hypothetical protein